MKIVWQTVRRIANEILGVKGLRSVPQVVIIYESDIKSHRLEHFDLV